MQKKILRTAVDCKKAMKEFWKNGTNNLHELFEVFKKKIIIIKTVQISFV